MSFIQPNELPYLVHPPIDGRQIPVSPFYEIGSKKFFVYKPLPDGRILVLLPEIMMEGSYISTEPAESLDIILTFPELVFQRFSFSEIIKALSVVDQDLLNAVASIQKYFVILKFANENSDRSAQLMITTEIEYAFANHRAFYDCLHQIIRKLHKIYQPKSPDIPDSFARIVEKEQDFLEKKYLFPTALIEFYSRQKHDFLIARNIRDNIFHHGHSLEMIFRFEDGFALRMEDRLIKDLEGINIWPEDLMKPNRLGSVLALLVFLVQDMFDAMDRLASAIIACFPDPPPEVAPGYHMYLRSSVSKHFVQLANYRKIHWFDSKTIF